MQYKPQKELPEHIKKKAAKDMRELLSKEIGWRTMIKLSDDDLLDFASLVMELYIFRVKRKTGIQYQNPFPQAPKEVPCAGEFERRYQQALKERTPEYVTDRFNMFNEKYFINRFFGAEWIYWVW